MTSEPIVSIQPPIPTFWVIQLDTGDKHWFTEAEAFNAAHATLSKVGKVHFQAFIPITSAIKMAGEAVELTLNLTKEQRKAAKKAIKNDRDTPTP